ncbi:hypothetical protein ACFLQK_02115, partial [bacterium]
MQMRKWIMILAVMMAAAPAACLAGTAKSAGGFEILSDVTDFAGSGGRTAGNFSLHSSIGQSVGHVSSTSGNYELVGGFLGVVDETAPTLEFTSPTAADTASGTIDVVATAFDENGLQWTLYYGPGATPDSYTQLSTGAANVATSTIGSWDTSAFAGTYSAVLVGTDDRGNTATATVSFSVVNMITISGTIPVHKWVLVSTPIQPTANDPVSMYGTGEYKVYRWNPEKEYVQDFGRYEYPATVDAGHAYWVKSYENDKNYSYTGPLTDTSQDYAQAVKIGWNQVGTPFNDTFPWGQVRVRYNSNVYDLTTAAGMGLISSTVTSFDNASNSMLQHDTTLSMVLQTGYNIRVYADLELLFDPDTAGAAPRQLAKVIRSPYDYRVKISARGAVSADLDNYFGTAHDAAGEFDRHDFEEPMKTPGSTFTSLYFPHENWQRNAGRYANDVRTTAAAGEEDWPLNVETTETGETITLSWNSSDIPADFYTFTLVNVDTGERIDMAAQDTCTYVAAGEGTSETHFRIEVRGGGEATEISRSIVLTPG